MAGERGSARENASRTGCAHRCWRTELKRIRSLRTAAAGHAFMQNLRRGQYEITVDLPAYDRVPVAFTDLARYEALHDGVVAAAGVLGQLPLRPRTTNTTRSGRDRTVLNIAVPPGGYSPAGYALAWVSMAACSRGAKRFKRRWNPI